MRKTLLLLLAAMLLPLSALALDLQPNQKLLGHYTTDDIKTGGCWGKSILRGTRPIATDLTPDELALFQGSQIKAFRVGLSLSTDVTRVFVIPVAPDGTLGEETEWPCSVSDQGWNLVELDSPYLINLPGDYSLRIGFDYEQVGSAKPISAVMVGTVYPSLCYYKDEWKDYGVNLYGNLSLQVVCENDNFPQYVIRAKDLAHKKKIKIGDDLSFSFKAYTLGTETIAAGALTFDIAVDGTVVKTISNPIALNNQPATISDVISTDELTNGMHTLTVTTATLNGEPINNPVFLTSSFLVFEYGFTRQMRLVEQFTSTYCTHCPKGSATLTLVNEMRGGDLAWVGVHQDMNGTDVFRTLQCDTIAGLQDCTGYPEASFDRTVGFETPNGVCGGIGYTDANYGANIINSFLEATGEDPANASIFINSTYDPDTRQAVITINGELVPNYEDFMGSDSKLTVYITEDGLVAPQYNNGTWVNNYVHNGVLRQALVSARGVALNKTGDTYKNVFTVNIPNAWNADNLNIVAFISRPLGNTLTDIYVTNTNKRKFGEFDEPTVVPGDVDGDGSVNINDVSAIIDLLLNNGASAGADVNEDGNVNIDDLSFLIDQLLHNN